MAFLELSNVSKTYGTKQSRTEVLSDINLSMERGEFVAIVGYSGAGKTTLLSIIAGLIKADHGTVRLNDKTGKVERVGGIKWTIKDGIAYDAKKLAADVQAMVEKQKRARGAKTTTAQ